MIYFLSAVGIGILVWLLFFLENRRFVVRRTIVYHEKIPVPFTVVQVSDLHDKAFGKKQEKLLRAIYDAKPDYIVITGDLFNRKKASAVLNAFCFVQNAVSVAPVYFAEGNHECALKEIGEKDIKTIREMGVCVLEDAYIDLRGFRLIGLRQYATPEKLSAMLDPHKFNLVLSHRPERFPEYAETDADFILSGHAHGGQVRIFGIGLYAPEQGVFPKYTSGVYQRNDTQMYVSRGLGSTVPVPRVFNTPELTILEFKPMEAKESNYVCKRN